MKKWFLRCLVTIVSVAGWTGIAQADLTVYHDQASFLAAAGSTTLYDFESNSAGDISPPSYSGGASTAIQDFGDFRIDSTSTGIYLSEIRDHLEDDPPMNNKDIYVNTYNNAASLKIIFNHAVAAFGFTYVAEGNQSYDHSTFSLNGTTWDLGTPGDSGFFGIIDTTGTLAAGTAFSFGQNSINWSGVSFDNLRYTSNGPAPVPVPSAILLGALGTGSVGFLRRWSL